MPKKNQTAKVKPVVNIKEMSLEERLALLEELKAETENDKQVEMGDLLEGLQALQTSVIINKDIIPALTAFHSILSDNYSENDILEIIQFTRYSTYRSVISDVLEKGINKLTLDSIESVVKACEHAQFTDIGPLEYQVDGKTITLRIKEKTKRTSKKAADEAEVPADEADTGK
jgi:hypothetical protein